MKIFPVNKFGIALAMLAVCGTASAELPFISTQAQFNITPPAGTTFTITGAFAWASASSVFAAPDCTCPLVAGADTDVQIAGTATAVGGSGCFENNVESTSFSTLSATATGINWSGVWFGQSNLIHCVPELCLAAGAYGAHVEFTSDGDFTIPVPGCPTPTGSLSDSRRVDANIFCLPSGPVSSSVVNHGLTSVSVCSSSPTALTAGAYILDYISLTIDDERDDVTGDGRFNQDDVDFLSSNVVGTSFATDPLYLNRFDFVSEGVIDNDDIDILQCFVDACLDARRIGDANCDNIIDCADLLIAGAQPFAGELFTGSVYNVGLDADLDGDNDAADKDALRDILLAVEPANFILDTSINFFDNSEFLNLFGAGDLRADINGDGSLNFFDVSAFLDAYANPLCLTP